MKVVFYEKNIENLYPIVYTRPVFDIFCGAATLYQVISKVFAYPLDFIVRDEIKEISEMKFQSDRSESDVYLYLNASLVPSFSLAEKLLQLVKDKEPAMIYNEKELIGFITKESNLEINSYLENQSVEKKLEINWPVFKYCWETVVYNQKFLGENLEYLKNNYQELRPGVYVGQNVILPENAVFETMNGIIIIDDNTKVLPFSYLAGPLYIGKNCLIKEFSSIKDNCCFGPVCKIGGEVETTIIQGYSNKQHYGFLGHSYLGEWINIAAGTSNSDLKNTYSTVKVNGVETNQQFLGTIIGDFSRTAINTSIFTGRVIGVSSYIYGTITRDIVSFTNYAAHLGCVIELDLPVAIKAQQAMFSRRNRLQTSVDIELLKTIFEQTKPERKDREICCGRLDFKI